MPDPVRIRKLYYLHKRVPTDIVATFDRTRSGRPKTHINISLNTSEWAAAKRVMPDAEKKAQALFDAHRRNLGIGDPVVSDASTQTPQQACEAFYAQLQRQEQKYRQDMLDRAKADPESFFVSYYVSSGGAIISMHQPSYHPYSLDDLHGLLAEELADDAKRRLQNAVGALAVMDLEDIRQMTGETDQDQLVLLARTRIKFLEILASDPSALFNAMPHLGPVNLRSAPSDGVKNPKATAVADEWLGMRVGPQGTGWSPERKGTWTEALAVFVEVCGDKPISAYTVDDKGDLQDAFRKLPARRNKLPETRDKGVEQQISIAAQRGLPPMHAKTANEYLRMIEALFDWCKGRYSVMEARNPFEGSALPVSKTNLGEKPRDRFTLDELNLIFANPLYGERADTDWKYWAPLLQLYTGARSNSILRLKVADIRTEDGITFLDINGDEYSDERIKRTDKSEAGFRQIPIHPDLLELGFLGFVASREGRELLFDDLKVSKRGKFTKPYGDWFRNHLLALGLKRKGRDTHSFRHTWDHFAESSRIESEWRDRLLGHARQGMRRVYGGKTELQLLNEEMRKLRFSGLNLSHLKR